MDEEMEMEIGVWDEDMIPGVRGSWWNTAATFEIM